MTYKQYIGMDTWQGVLRNIVASAVLLLFIGLFLVGAAGPLRW